jgi:hypothetical protein
MDQAAHRRRRFRRDPAAMLARGGDPPEPPGAHPAVTTSGRFRRCGQCTAPPGELPRTPRGAPRSHLLRSVSPVLAVQGWPLGRPLAHPAAASSRRPRLLCRFRRTNLAQGAKPRPRQGTTPHPCLKQLAGSSFHGWLGGLRSRRFRVTASTEARQCAHQRRQPTAGTSTGARRKIPFAGMEQAADV